MHEKANFSLWYSKLSSPWLSYIDKLNELIEHDNYIINKLIKLNWNTIFDWTIHDLHEKTWTSLELYLDLGKSQLTLSWERN